MIEQAMNEQRQYEELMRLKKETFTRQINDDQMEKQKQKMAEKYQTEQEKE